jgi:methionyl-tRNA formyltransferase
MKVAVFCNSPLSMPTLQLLYSQKLLAGMVIPVGDHDAAKDLVAIATNYNIPHKIVSKNELKKLSTWLQLINVDVAWVLTFPFKIPNQILNTPPLGVFNFHFGALPTYRGSDPVFWQIKNQEANGAVTIHKMDAGWDTGAIALQAPVPIRKGDTYGMHTRILSEAGAQMAHEFLQRLQVMGNKLPLILQDQNLAKYYKRPGLKEVSIDWETMPADEIIALVDACNPWNKGAYTKWQQTAFKIVQISYKEQKAVNNQKLIPGTIINCSEKKTIDVITVDNKTVSIEIISIDEGIFTADFLVKLGLKENQLLVKTF